ncbi:MAG: prepilin peptidase [Sphingobacteriaceae bacterium]
MDIFLLICVALISSILIYQDFSSRRINLLLCLAFIVLILFKYVLPNTYDQLFLNTAFSTLYFLLSYLVLKLYFYLRGSGKEAIVNTKIGWGDVILFFAVGCTIEPERVVSFFAIVFTVSIILHFLLSQRKEVPLAAYLLVFYNIYLVSMPLL